jgi:hypothetical protein
LTHFRFCDFISITFQIEANSSGPSLMELSRMLDQLLIAKLSLQPDARIQFREIQCLTFAAVSLLDCVERYREWEGNYEQFWRVEAFG